VGYDMGGRDMMTSGIRVYSRAGEECGGVHEVSARDVIEMICGEKRWKGEGSA